MDWLNMPPLTALRAFSAFAEAGTMVAAGNQLNVSHAAISQQLRGLEERLGVALLDRTGRSPTLTPEGAQLAAALAEGFGAIARVVEELTGRDADRPLQISATPSFASAWLMPRLASFRAAFPQIDLMIDPSAEVKSLGPGGFDVALRYGSGQWAGVDSELLVRSPIVVVAATELVGDRPIDGPADLRDFHWFQELGTNEATEWFARFGVVHDRARGITALPGNLMLEAARQGHGVAITAKVFVEPDIQAGRLRLLFEDGQHKGYYLVTRTGVLRPAVRDFVRWLRRQVQG